MENIIFDNELAVRKLIAEDKEVLLKWLQDVNVLEYWEGKSALFDMERIEEDFYGVEACEMERGIIEFKNVPIGYIQIYNVDNILEEYDYQSDKKGVYAFDLFIANVDYRDKGIGTRLLNLVKDYLNSLGASTIIIDPHCDNLRAVHTYNKVGFEIVKILKEHEMHDGILVDCYLMECVL